MGRRKSHRSRFSWVKLLLALALPACLVVAVWTGYVLFFTHQTDPVLGTLVFLVGVGLSIYITYLLRSSRYRGKTPSFMLVFFSLTVIALVCAFAGIQPLASYKDAIITKYNNEWWVTLEEKATNWEEAREIKQEQERQTIENEVLIIVNEARGEKGLPLLKRDSYLDTLAREHSQYMRDNNICSHIGFDSRADQIMMKFGYVAVAENCAEGYHSANSLVNGWLTSPGHAANIMDASFRLTGIGYVDGYATQIFTQ